MMADMDRIAAMTAFVRVVEAGSFTRAADTLNLPNASVTRLIQALEDELKVRLLHRTTRSVTVTPEGATYYERVVRLLAELTDIETSTRQSIAKPSGRIRVETSTGIASAVIVPALPEFNRTYPDVAIDLGIGNRHADLVAEGLDCAVRGGEVTDQSLVARRIGEFHFQTCATPAFLQAHGTPATPQELQSLPTIGMASSRAGRPMPFRYEKAGETLELSPEHVLVVNDTNSHLAAGLGGLGIIHAPSYAVNAALEEGRLVALLCDWRTPIIPYYVVYAPNRYLSGKVRVFIDWVVALFEQHPYLKRGQDRS
jgi:DNA-binding transcriptional LysR family regulator